MEKNPGGQKFWQRGGGEISRNSILPPQKCVLPLKCPPPPPKFRDLAPLLSGGFKSHPLGAPLVNGNDELVGMFTAFEKENGVVSVLGVKELENLLKI